MGDEEKWFKETAYIIGVCLRKEKIKIYYVLSLERARMTHGECRKIQWGFRCK